MPTKHRNKRYMMRGGEPHHPESYPRYSDDLYIKFMSALGIMAMLWFLISRNLIRHKYSEVLCYGLMSLAMLVSLFLVLIAGVKHLKKTSPGFMGALQKCYNLIIYIITKGTPALLILVQLGFLIYLMSSHADYLLNTETLPPMFNKFNISAAVMLMFQIFTWRNQVTNLILNRDSSKNPLILPGFILAAILSSLAISQLYIILEFLKTDC